MFKLNRAIGINSKRFYSVNPNKSLANILVYPVTSQKSYLLFKFNESLINDNSPLVRYENKLTALALKGWNSLKASDKSYNKKIVYYVNKFLDTIPWTEDSLRSIPSSSTLLRQIKLTETELKESNDKKLISPLDVKAGDYDLINIPVYYPSSILTKENLQLQLKEASEFGLKYHKKHMLITAVLIPLSLPIALVPVVPNVPGFYLAYRFYCNFKAYLGAQHLKELIESNHIIYKESWKLNNIFSEMNEEPIKINEDIIEEIVKLHDIEPVRGSLLKTLHQARAHHTKTQ